MMIHSLLLLRLWRLLRLHSLVVHHVQVSIVAAAAAPVGMAVLHAGRVVVAMVAEVLRGLEVVEVV